MIDGLMDGLARYALAMVALMLALWLSGPDLVGAPPAAVPERPSEALCHTMDVALPEACTWLYHAPICGDGMLEAGVGCYYLHEPDGSWWYSDGREYVS